MIELTLPDMTCGHCVKTVTETVKRIDPKATPLLARKTERAQNLEELLFALIVLGDDRVVDQVVIA